MLTVLMEYSYSKIHKILLTATDSQLMKNNNFLIWLLIQIGYFHKLLCEKMGEIYASIKFH